MRGAALIAPILLLAPLPACAATLEIVTAEPLSLRLIDVGYCSLRLSGRIESGDADRLRAILAEERFQRRGVALFDLADDAEGTSLCLHSNGGSFEEAVRLVQVLAEHPVVTIVPENASCLSACALVFLAGTLPSVSYPSRYESRPYRILHVAGRLGFHAPRPEIGDSDRLMRFEEATEYFRTALAAIQMITAALSSIPDTNDRDKRFPHGLLVEMLSRYGTEEFYEIDDLDRAGWLGVRLAGVPSIALDWEDVFRLCDNVGVWRRGLHDWRLPEPRPLSYTIGDPDETRGMGAAEPPISDLSTEAGVVIAGQEFRCRIHGRQSSLGPEAPGDQFTLELDNQRTIGVDEWQALPYFFTLRSIVEAGESLANLAYSILYSNPQASGFDSRRALTELQPGYTYVGHWMPVENILNDWLIELDRANGGRIHWPSGQIETVSYRLDGDAICFGRQGSAPRPLCGRFRQGSLDFDDASVPDAEIDFARPGRIAR